ncbi:MAG: C39 family peptidase [Phycisphaerales bacterium]|nr:C39 family peptidase [Phycisphaerales bacterium]
MPSVPPSAPDGRRASSAGHVLPLTILRQPNDETCGPTCLHALYRFWGDPVELDDVVKSVRSLDHDGVGRGTLAVNLGLDALRRGYAATLYTFNLTLFDPTWFVGPDGSAETLIARLRAQAAAKWPDDHKSGVATESNIEFLERGGRIRFEDLTSRLILSHLRAGRPVLTGLSATYLYHAAREYGPNDDADDIRGEPAGHFVLIHGYDPSRRVVHVADPLEDNPAFASRNYTVRMARLVPAIMLGVLTHDANLLIVAPPAPSGGSTR